MFIKKISKNPNVRIKTFRVFASRQEGKVVRVQLKSVRKKSKKK